MRKSSSSPRWASARRIKPARSVNSAGELRLFRFISHLIVGPLLSLLRPLGLIRKTFFLFLRNQQKSSEHRNVIMTQARRRETSSRSHDESESDATQKKRFNDLIRWITQTKLQASLSKKFFRLISFTSGLSSGSPLLRHWTSSPWASILPFEGDENFLSQKKKRVWRLHALLLCPMCVRRTNRKAFDCCSQLSCSEFPSACLSLSRG